MKRYVSEPGSETVIRVMQEADSWFICRHGFVETARAVGLSAGPPAIQLFKAEWSAFGIIEIDQPLAEHAASLALEHSLRSLDSIHLAAALILPTEDLVFATWDRRLHQAAKAEALELLPDKLN